MGRCITMAHPFFTIGHSTRPLADFIALLRHVGNQRRGFALHIFLADQLPARASAFAALRCGTARLRLDVLVSVVHEFSELLKSYRIGTVRGDRYAGEWPREQFRKHGIDYLPADKNKSELYGALLPLLNSRRVDLLDDKKLIAQLVALERRTARGGLDSIDHAPGSHDDVANCVAGALLAANFQAAQVPIVVPSVVGQPRYNPFSESSLVEAQANAYL